MSRTYTKNHPYKFFEQHASKKPLILHKFSKLGPGGINCNCCTHGIHPSELKVLARRAERRKLKINLQSDEH